MNERDLLSLWSESNEGQFFERKSAWTRPQGSSRKRRKATEIAWDIAETLCAMANADGGDLIVGIEDDGEVSGIPHPSDKIQQFREAPGSRNYVVPTLHYHMEEFRTADGRLVLHYSVDSSPEVHQLANGKYLFRVGDRSVPFPADQIAALKATKVQGSIERSHQVGASLDDIDLELVSSLQPVMGLDGSAEDALRQLRLVDDRNGRLLPNLSGLLLFGKEPTRWHPGCDIDFVRWEGTERRGGDQLNIERRTRIAAPLATLIQHAYSTIRPLIRERHKLHDLFFSERLEYPTFVWQEAIVNAVGHRDYSIRGASIQIWMFDDRMEVRSPGLPPPPATINALNQGIAIHLSRNPLIVRTLALLGYMRELGEGIPRMFSIMESEGFYPPQFTDIGGAYFQVTLRNEPVYDQETLEWLRTYQAADLSGDQKRLLAYARAHGSRFTNRDYQKLVGLDLYGASISIKALVRKQIIRSLTKGSRVYEIVEKSDEVQRIPVELEDLLPLLRESSEVSNEDVRLALHMSRSAARRVLTDLWKSGWLDRTGERRWTRYRLARRL